MTSLALLIIDVQTGAFDGKLLPPIHLGDQLLSQTKKLLDSARKAKVPIVYIQHCAAEGLLVKGTEAWPLHHKVAPEEGEIVIEKFASSAFEGTVLDNLISKAEIQGVVVCGLQSEHCIFNTSLDALYLGLNVYVCSDAHSTWSSEKATAAEIIAERNEELAKTGVSVVPASTIVALLETQAFQ